MNQEIGFEELLKLLLENSKTLFWGTVISAIVSIAIALSLPNFYRAEVVLAANNAGSSSSLTRMASQLGGLASLAGINLSNDNANKTNIAIEIIKSWNFAESFIFSNDIAPEVFAVESWSRLSDKLNFDDSLYDEHGRVWVRQFDAEKGESANPSSWELYEKFRDYVGITINKENGLITVSVEYYSPVIAADWARKIVKQINSHMRLSDAREAQQNIEYLEKQLLLTDNSELKSVFYTLIEEQNKNLMLANVSQEYVFKTISEAKIPEVKSKPKRALICVLGTLMGGFLSIFYVLIVSLKKTRREA